jgi:hypothetical protein
MKLPLWNCRNNPLARRRLEEWTLDQLDKLDNELAMKHAELVTERDIRDMEAMQSDEFHEWWAEEDFRRQQRARVAQAVKAVKAAKAKDKAKAKDLIKRLTANDPELQRLAIRLLTRG